MNISQAYIAASIIALLVALALVVLLRRHEPVMPLRPLAGLAFALGLAGMLFIENRLVGYGLLAVGLVLAVIDIIKREKR